MHDGLAVQMRGAREVVHDGFSMHEQATRT
jgi:hypothetical protein